jgi:hypothetical protein
MLVSAGDITIVDVNDGTSVYTASVYVQQVATPSAPSGGTYNFSTATLVAPSGWVSTIPSGSAIPIWVSTFSFSTVSPSTTITATTWSTPVKLVQDGTRAQFTASVQMGSAAWSDTSAYNAIIALANSGNTLKVGDRVTEYYPNSSSPSWVLTKEVTAIGNPGTWAAPGTLIDGNLIVSGTVTAAKIESTGLSIKDVNGNVILAAGSALPFSQRFLNTTNLPAENANNTYVDANGAIQGVSLNGGTVVNNALIKVGGTNLMRNSGQFESLDSWATNGSTISLDYTTLYAGYPTIKLVGVTIAGGQGIVNSTVMRLKANTEYTVSALVKGSAITTNEYDKTLHIQVWTDENAVSIHQDVGISFDTAVSTSWKTIYQTFKTPTSAAACYGRFYFFNTTEFVLGYTLNVASVKLEEGNKYSTWTPSVDEIQNSEIRFNPNLVRSVDTWSLVGVSVEQNIYAANKQALLLPAGASTITASSEILNLIVSTDYTVSFEAWSTVAGDILRTDLFPDTLPEYAITLTTTPTLYSYIFNSGDTNMGSCNLRMFSTITRSGSIRVCDVKIERSSVRTPWLPNVLDQKWANITGSGKPADNATRNVFRGNWATATAYVIGDIVIDAYGYGWSCIIGHTSSATNITPTYPTTSNTYWTLYTVKGADGASGVVIDLSNDTAVIPTDATGNNGIFTNATTTASIYVGASDTSASWTFAQTASTGITSTASNLNRTVAITAMTTDTGYIDFTATRSGYPNQTIRFTIAKAKAGSAGATAIVNYIELQSSTIKKDKTGAFNPSTSITFNAKQISGSSAPTTYPGIFKVYTLATPGGAYTLAATSTLVTSYTYNYPITGVVALKVELYDSTGATLFDNEVIPYIIDGIDGVANYVVINGDQAFKYLSGSSTPTSASITLTATLYGSLTTYDWEYWNGTAWANLSGTQNTNTYSLAYNATEWGSLASLRVRCVSGTFSDEMTIVKLYDGANGTNAVSGYLTNEVHTEAALNDGTGYSLTNAGGTFKVYNGTTDVTTSSTFNVSGGVSGVKAQNGLTFTINTTSGAYTLSGTAWTSDTESFTVTATYGSTTITKVYSIDKAKKGANGTGGISAVLTNETHTFPSDTSGIVSSYTGSGTDIYVYEGGGQLTYDGVGTTAGTWKITTTATNITVGAITDAGTYASIGAAGSFATGFDTANIVYAISGTTLGGTTFSFNKTQTFTKAKTGVSGSNARAVDLTANAQTFVYNSAGSTPSPSSATLTATARNATGALTYAFKKNGVVVQAASATATYTYTPPASYATTADQMSVDLYENTILVASDTLSMSGIKPGINGTNGLSGFLTNEAHVVSTANDGTGYSLTAATGTFKVYSGATDVTTSSTFTVTTATFNGLTLAVGGATGVYTLSGTAWTSDSETFSLNATYSGTTITKTFKISKSKTGSIGLTGGTITLTANRVATFTATDGALDSGQTDIILTANLLNITGATYTWTFSGFQTAPTASTTATQTITSAQFGTSKGAKVTCTVAAGSSTYVDDMSIVRLEKSTAAAGATVGATWGTNLTGQPSDQQLLNSYATFTPYAFWNFYNSANNFTTGGITLTLNSDTISLTETTTDPAFITPTVSIDGTKYNKLQIKIKRISGTSWDGGVFYSNSAHGFTEGANKGYMTQPTWDSTFKVIEVDMKAITNTGQTVAPDWFGSTITSIRFDFGAGGSVFEIASIAVGSYSGVQIDSNNAPLWIANAAIGSAQVGTLTASNINSNGLSIKDVNGNVILSAASGVSFNSRFPNTTNLPAENATVGATFGTNISGQITASNASTYIANAAIGSAQVGTLTASNINSNGLSIKDVNGNVILSAGSGLSFSSRFPNTTNLPAENATVGATFGTNISGQITSSNVTTYIGPGAISTNQISANYVYAGTVNATQVNAGTLTGFSISGGSLSIGVSTDSYGGRAFNVSSAGEMLVNTLVGRPIGSATSSFFSWNGTPSATGLNPASFTLSNGNSTYYPSALVALVSATATNTAAHAFRGVNYKNNAGGVIGANNGYDFYADGAGTNYGPFTGAHDGLIPNDLIEIFEEGDIVVDDICINRKNWSNTIFTITPSNNQCQKGVLGVLCKINDTLENVQLAALVKEIIPTTITDESGTEKTGSSAIMIEDYDKIKQSYTAALINALGEGQMNVCGENGDIEKGDLIVSSSIRGKGMKQPDDIVRSYTVAKARESIKFSDKTEVKQIACIYMCG